MNHKRVFDRRSFLSLTGAAAAAGVTPRSAFAQSQGLPLGPEPGRYPSAVWKVLDERFRKYMIGNTPLIREWTGALWAEGPAWNGVGRYVVFSDIPNNVQLRWDEVTGKVTPFRMPVERETLAETLYVYMGIASHRTNKMVSRLTALSMIFLPLTFLCGVYGMNFVSMPEKDWPYGYAFFWGLSVCITGGLLWMMKRGRWI